MLLAKFEYDAEGHNLYQEDIQLLMRDGKHICGCKKNKGI